MSIFPLPQFEADLEAARQDAEAYARLNAPKTLVVKFGVMRLIGEFPYSGDVKPGCGSKIVVRTHRGTEMGEMLTSTCPNAGCSKSITRKDMLEYIERSGGKDYPFFEGGRALRVASAQDMAEQARLDGLRPAMIRKAREIVSLLRLPMKIVEAEPLLGGERLTFYFTSEERIDFRDLVGELAREFAARIEMRQVGARDEARLAGDYERCGQHCCCKQFLKVLKPISIKAAKTQKNTLDPLKISGRCGRLMCCLRYEDQTYEELSARLPKLKRRVGTPHGAGTVVDRQILTQLVLVRLDHDGRDVAVTVEELMPPDDAPRPAATPTPAAQPPSGRPPSRPGGPPPRTDRSPPGAGDPLRGMSPERVEQKINDRARSRDQGAGDQEAYRRRSERDAALGGPAPERSPHRTDPDSAPDAPGVPGAPGAPDEPDGQRRRRRRRRAGPRPGDGAPRGPGPGPDPSAPDQRAGAQPPPPRDPSSSPGDAHSDEGQRRRRRRRRRRGSGGSQSGGPPQGPEGGGGTGGGPPM